MLQCGQSGEHGELVLSHAVLDINKEVGYAMVVIVVMGKIKNQPYALLHLAPQVCVLKFSVEGNVLDSHLTS